MTTGRPKKTTKDFPKDWKETVIKEMSEGASQEEIQGILDISDKTLVRLMKDDKEFLRTIKRGRRLSKTWWMKKGRNNLENKEFSAVLWYMNMKNRFGWADKKMVDLTSGGKPILDGATKNE